MGKVKAKKKTAAKPVEKPVAFAGDVDAFVTELWSLRDPEIALKSYEKAAKADKTLALALARFRAMFSDDTAEMIRAAMTADGTAGLVAPLVMTNVFGRWPGDAVRALTDWVLDPRLVPIMRDALVGQTDADWKQGAWAIIAANGSDEDLAAARRQLKKQLTRLTTVCARRGDVAAQEQFAAELTAWVDAWPTAGHMVSSEFEHINVVVQRIGELRMTACVPALVRAVDTPLAMYALIALARIGDPAGAAAARWILDDVRGPDKVRLWAYALPAQWVCAALGERVDAAMAREACSGAVRPQRYGFPKKEEVVTIEGCAGEVLVRAGTDADREQLCAWITRPVAWHRDIGRAAHIALGRPVPELSYWDPARIAGSSLDELRGACSDPHAVFTDLVARELGERGESVAIDWAVDRLESVENFWLDVSDADEEEVDPSSAVALAIVRENRTAKRVTESSSGWIKALLSEQAMPYPEMPATGPQPDVVRLDHAPFVFGQQINGMALDHAGARLAVVGKELGQILDASTGDVLARLQLRFNWGYDCAFSPDDSLLAVAYHGCHLVVFDAATGVERMELPWPGGVPNGIKKCEWSPDGSRLAAGGSDGQAFVFGWPSGEVVWKGKATARGAFQTVLWSSDGRTCTFSEVSQGKRGPNFLHVVNVETRKAKKVAMPMSVWALLELPDGRTIAGGERKTLVLDAKRTPTSLKLATEGVVRLGAARDGTIVATTHTGSVVRWNLAGKKPTSRVLVDDAGELWAMAIRSDGAIYAGGTSLLRFAPDGTPITREGHVHTSQARGFAVLSDGSAISCGWDGQVLRWPAGFGTASVVRSYDARTPEITGTPDRSRAYVGIPAGVLVVPVDGEPTTLKLKKEEDVEALACDGELLVVATEKDRIVAFRTNDLGEAWSIKLRDATVVCFRGDGTLVVGNEDGELAIVDREGEIRWRRAEYRDLIDKLPHGNPHRTVIGVAAHGDRWAAASNDDSLRLFEGERRTRRFLVDAGLFNGVAFSPSGRRIVLTNGWGFQVFDVTSAEHLAFVPNRTFAGADELTRPCFVDDRHVLVGAENGSIFQVTLPAE